jgi:hypothetical protein
MASLANFFVIGGARCGTTSLDALLRVHPEIEVPVQRKELHYFDSEDFDPSHRPMDGYRRLNEGFFFLRRAVGEITPGYIVYPHALDRIRRYNPDARLVALLRNPVIRAHSNWALDRRRGRINETFRQCLDIERATAPTPATLFDRCHTNIVRGLYSTQIARVLGLFPADHVLFIKSEDFYARQALMFGRICDFLGVRRIINPTPVVAHAAPRPEPLSPEDWEYAFQLFAEDIARVQDVLGWNCADWRDPAVATRTQ